MDRPPFPPIIRKKPGRRPIVHYWGVLASKRIVAPCSPDVPEDARCTGVLSRITCHECLKLLKRERLH